MSIIILHLPRRCCGRRGPMHLHFCKASSPMIWICREWKQPVTYGLWLDHKGKIQADSFVIQKTKEDFLLLSYDCPAAVLQAHLEAHLIADEVVLHDETVEFGLLHAWPEFGPGEFSRRTIWDLRPTWRDWPIRRRVTSGWGRRPRGQMSWDFLAPVGVLEKVNPRIDGERSGGRRGGSSGHDENSGRHSRGATGRRAGRFAAGGGAGAGRGLVRSKGCYLGQESNAREFTRRVMSTARSGTWPGTLRPPAPADDSPVPLYIGDGAGGRIAKAG